MKTSTRITDYRLKGCMVGQKSKNNISAMLHGGRSFAQRIGRADLPRINRRTAKE
jgi:hypothetical protein